MEQGKGHLSPPSVLDSDSAPRWKQCAKSPLPPLRASGDFDLDMLWLGSLILDQMHG